MCFSLLLKYGYALWGLEYVGITWRNHFHESGWPCRLQPQSCTVACISLIVQYPHKFITSPLSFLQQEFDDHYQCYLLTCEALVNVLVNQRTCNFQSAINVVWGSCNISILTDKRVMFISWLSIFIAVFYSPYILNLSVILFTATITLCFKIYLYSSRMSVPKLDITMSCTSNKNVTL